MKVKLVVCRTNGLNPHLYTAPLEADIKAGDNVMVDMKGGEAMVAVEAIAEVDTNDELYKFILYLSGNGEYPYYLKQATELDRIKRKISFINY